MHVMQAEQVELFELTKRREKHGSISKGVWLNNNTLV